MVGGGVGGAAATRVWVAAITGARWVAMASWSTRGTTAVACWPDSTRVMSTFISRADWYRSAASLARAFRVTASMSGVITGSSWLGGTGASRTCWYATLTGDSPTNGGRPTSSSYIRQPAE